MCGGAYNFSVEDDDLFQFLSAGVSFTHMATSNTHNKSQDKQTEISYTVST